MLNKKTKKIIATTLIATTILVVTTPNEVKAMPAAEAYQIVQESALEFGPIAPYIVIGGTIIVAGMALNEVTSENQNIVQLARIPRLPDKAKPNEVIEKVHPKTGKIIQRRYYDENGNPKRDVDLYDHNDPVHHPWGEHIHDFVNGVRQPGREMTQWEKIKYLHVPQGMVNKPNVDHIYSK